MNRLFILCIDDQPEVLNALEQDLVDFEDHLEIEVCDSALEALDLMEEIDQDGDYLAMVISDQVMPKMTGVDLLTSLESDGRFEGTKKVLLTGLATHQDTIDAINSGRLDFYIQKPWTKEQITSVIKKGLTEFIIEKGIGHENFITILDQQTLYEALRRRG